MNYRMLNHAYSLKWRPLSISGQNRGSMYSAVGSGKGHDEAHDLNTFMYLIV